MSILIKAAAASRSVRVFAAASAPIQEAPPELVEDPELALLRAGNAELRELVEELRQAAPRAEAKAREEGRREGLSAARRDDDARIERLGEGIAALAAAWDDRLNSLDDLAALLARGALAKLFDESDDYADFVVRMIGRQIRQLRRETLLGIRVSPADFPDAAALAPVSAAAGAGSTAIATDADLPAGECRLDMQLGHLDLGVRSQWGQLSELLQQMAAAETRP